MPTEEVYDTPRATSPVREPEKKQQPERISLPSFVNFGDGSSFDLGLETYMTPSPPISKQPTEQESKQTDSKSHMTLDDQLKRDTAASLPDLASIRESIQRPATPEEELQPLRFTTSGNGSDFEPSSPESVIRHSPHKSSSPLTPTSPLSPEVTEPEATIRASGGVLETRKSSAPADFQTMAAARRQVSNTLAAPPPIRIRQDPGPVVDEDEDEPRGSSDCTQIEAGPPLQGRHRSSLVQLEIPHDRSDESLGFGLEKEFDRVVEAQKVAFELSLSRLNHPFHGRFPSSDHSGPTDVAKSISGDIPNLRPQGARALPGDQRARGHYYPTDGSQFANRSPERQRGYLMRQSTKVVVASHRTEEEAKPAASTTSEQGPPVPGGTMPARKVSQPTWTAEPWNGKTRRRSIRAAVETSHRKKPVNGSAPALAIQTSNAQDGLESVQEDDLADEEADEFDDGTERGRLFVKVVGLKDLDLPLPRGEL